MKLLKIAGNKNVVACGWLPLKIPSNKSLKPSKLRYLNVKHPVGAKKSVDYLKRKEESLTQATIPERDIIFVIHAPIYCTGKMSVRWPERQRVTIFNDNFCIFCPSNTKPGTALTHPSSKTHTVPMRSVGMVWILCVEHTQTDVSCIDDARYRPRWWLKYCALHYTESQHVKGARQTEKKGKECYINLLTLRTFPQVL